MAEQQSCDAAPYLLQAPMLSEFLKFHDDCLELVDGCFACRILHAAIRPLHVAMHSLHAGVTPDPLDHSFVWQLLTVLQAVDALLVEDASGCAPIQVNTLCLIASID